MFEAILKELGLEKLEILAYTELTVSGACTATNLAKLLKIPRSSVYQLLKNLITKGFVVEDHVYSKEYRSMLKVFYPVDIESIQLLVQKNIEKMNNLKIKLKTISKIQPAKDINHLVSPKFQIFYGEDKVQNILNDMLLYSGIETFAFWPISDMIDILGEEFFSILNKIRIKNNLYTRAIWSNEKSVNVKKYPFLGSAKEFKREIRVYKGKLDFSMGYWSYANKVAFLSSKEEGFGFIIESAELVQMLRSQFDIIWNLSEKLDTESSETKSFLEELK
jgi:sugar-specific transcriptional regulator TrmB